MLGNQRAQGIFPGDDVHRTGRHHVLDQFRNAQRSQRRERRRLEHDRAACDQRRHDLLNGHHDREVPGHDAADHAHRHTAGTRQTRIVVLAYHVIQCQRRLRSSKSGCAVNFLLRLRMGLALLAGQKAIEFVGISLDRCRDTLDHLLTFFLRGFLPFFERSSRGSDCTVQFILAASWYAPDHLLVGRVQNLQPLAIVDHFAVDQVLIVCHRFSLLAGIQEFSLRNILSGFVA